MTKHLSITDTLHGSSGRLLSNFAAENIPALWDAVPESIIGVGNTGLNYTGSLPDWSLATQPEYPAFKLLFFKPHVTSLASPNLSLSGLPLLPILFEDGDAPKAGALVTTITYLLRINSTKTAFELLSGPSAFSHILPYSTLRHVNPENEGDWDRSGATDNLATLIAAHAAALPNNLYIDGGGMENIIGINGANDIAWNAAGPVRLRGLTLKDLRAGTRPLERRMLYANAVGKLYLDHVKFDKNGNGLGGSLAGGGAACVYSVSNTDVQIEFCEFTGNDRGNGIFCFGSPNPRILYNRFYSLLYVHQSPADDAPGVECTQSLVISFCTEVQVVGNNFSHSGSTDQTLLNRDQHSRGISVTQSQGIIAHNTIYRYDQAIDLTGGNSRHMTITANIIRNIRTFGIKMANSTTGHLVANNILHNIGSAPIVVSVGGDAPNLSSKVLINSNLISGVGTNGLFGATCGILLVPGAGTFGHTKPRGVIARANHISAETDTSTFTVADSSTLLLAKPLLWTIGQKVRLTTTGVLPAGLSLLTDYWALPVDNSFNMKLAASFNDSEDAIAIGNISGGSGTHTITQVSSMQYGGYNDSSVTGTGPPNIWGSDNTVYGALTGEVVGWSSTRASARGSQSVASGAAGADLLVTVVDEDTLGAMAVSSANVTCKLAGKYQLICAAEWDSSNLSYRALIPYLDTGSGYAVDAYAGTSHNPNGSTTTRQSVIFERRLAVGDKMKFKGIQETGGALNIIFRLTFNRVAE